MAVRVGAQDQLLVMRSGCLKTACAKESVLTMKYAVLLWAIIAISFVFLYLKQRAFV